MHCQEIEKVSVYVCFMSSIAHLKYTCVDMRVCRKLLYISLKFTLLVKQNLTDVLQQVRPLHSQVLSLPHRLLCGKGGFLGWGSLSPSL